MNIVVRSMLLLMAVALAPASQAASRSATMPVSFTVVDSCSVRVEARQPSVQCQLATPSAVSEPAPQPAPASTASSVPQADADTKVVTITF